MNATDKLIQKKVKELIARGESADSHPIFQSRWRKFFIGFGMIIVLFGFTLLILSKSNKFHDVTLGLSLVAIAVIAFGAWFIQKGRSGASFYKLVDTYRDALIDKGIRSIKDLSALTDSSPDEIVDEFKELQEVGLFRNFSIDRKNMQLIENAGWGDTGSNKLRQVAFSCSSCGANNSIYTEESSRTGACEYCSSSVAL